MFKILPLWAKLFIIEKR